MKRNEALKVITKVLKNWENCKLTKKASNEVLTALEDLGIILPPEIEVDSIEIDNIKMPVYSCEWE